jgi:dihydroorotate dehydrogenase
LNLSCPNTNRTERCNERPEIIPVVEEALPAIKWALGGGLWKDYLGEKLEQMRIIAKIPPLRWMEYVEPLYEVGVRCFHCCNTIKLGGSGGALSGKTLKPYSLWCIEELRKRYGDGDEGKVGGGRLRIIGGGGVTYEEDYRDYKRAGADYVAIGSVLLNPLNWGRIRKLIDKINSLE